MSGDVGHDGLRTRYTVQVTTLVIRWVLGSGQMTIMRAGEPNPDEKIAAESSEPGKESDGGPSTTPSTAKKSKLSSTVITAVVVPLTVAFVGAAGVVIAAKIKEQHASTPSQATAPSRPEDSGDMPVPNCLTCITGAGGRTFTEQADGGSAKPTFRNPLVFGGLGRPVQPGEKIEVVCRFYQPDAPPSVKHDGWWYLIASSPWNRKYYTVANSYLNGDPPEGPYSTNVDNGVPECTAKR